MLAVWTGKADFRTSVGKLSGCAGLPVSPALRRQRPCRMAGQSSSVCQLWAQVRDPPQWIRCSTTEEDAWHPHWVSTCMHMHTCNHGHTCKHSVPLHLWAGMYIFKHAHKRKQKWSTEKMEEITYTRQQTQLCFLDSRRSKWKVYVRIQPDMGF